MKNDRVRVVKGLDLVLTEREICIQEKLALAEMALKTPLTLGQSAVRDNNQQASKRLFRRIVEATLP